MEFEDTSVKNVKKMEEKQMTYFIYPGLELIVSMFIIIDNSLPFVNGIHDYNNMLISEKKNPPTVLHRLVYNLDTHRCVL